MPRKRKQQPETKEYAVPYRVELSGILCVEATSPEEAVQFANGLKWEDDDFYSRAEIVNWEVMGEAKEW